MLFEVGKDSLLNHDRPGQSVELLANDHANAIGQHCGSHLVKLGAAFQIAASVRLFVDSLDNNAIVLAKVLDCRALADWAIAIHSAH